MILDRWQRFARRRAERAGALVVDVSRAEIWRAAGGRCQCAGECGRGHAGRCEATFSERGSWHADHTLPLRPADPRVPPGPHVPANLRALCPDCNRAKSNRVVALPDGPLRRALVQTAIIQARLARVGVPAYSVLDGARALAPTMAPHVITLRLLPAPGHAHLDARALAEVRAGVNHPGARVYTHGAELRVEIPRWPRPIVPLASMPRAGLRFGVGVDARGQVAAVDLSASPHVLVAGQTRSGKSEMLRVLVWHLHRAGAGLVLVDTDGKTFDPFARARGLACAVARDPDAAHDAVELARRMMDDRPVDVPQAPLVLVIDEAHMLRADTRDTVIDIAKRGAKRSVQVIVATHRPTRDVLPKVLTDQLTWSIAGRVKDSAGSIVILGESGAQHLQGAGDMIIAHGGQATRIQAALGAAADWARLDLADAPPAPAPPAPRADPRYRRKPLDERVDHLVRRWQETGREPSAAELNRTFRGATERNSRARDLAFEAIAASG